jgi:uncharacterized protein (TIGR03067 family)
MSDPRSIADLADLQGAWEQVGFEEDGVLNPPDEHGAPGALTTFDRKHFAVRTVEGAVLLEGAFELNAAVYPKAVDWIDTIGTDAGKTLRAIYKLEGDQFVFIAAHPGLPRPSVFRTTPGQTMRTFLRRRKPRSH